MKRLAAARCERGNIAPLAIVSIFVLVAIMAAAVDVGIAYCAKSHQEQALDAARASCMDAVTSQQAKYDDDPGGFLADVIASTVRSQGVGGDLTVWFYEAPKGSVPESERLWIVGMQVAEEVPTIFGKGLGFDSVSAASCRVVRAAPYASQKVWRPDQRICGKYAFSAGKGASQGVFTAVGSLEGFPAEMVEQVRKGNQG